MPFCAIIAVPQWSSLRPRDASHGEDAVRHLSFTDKTHLYRPNATVNKTLVILNDRRTSQTVTWTCSLVQDKKVLKKLNGSVTIPAGKQVRVPVTFTLPKNTGDFKLNATFTFAGNVRQTDTFDIRTVAPPLAITTDRVLLYDTKGITAQHFDRLGIPYRYYMCKDLNAPPKAVNVNLSWPTVGDLHDEDEDIIPVLVTRGVSSGWLVIGRESLDKTSVEWIKRRGWDGILVMEQTSKQLTELLGFRIAERGSRLLFPRVFDRATMPFFIEGNECLLRDWAGSSTLLPDHLTDLDDVEVHDPRWQWCGQTSTRVWRCGNRNSVASVLIEKPAVGDWLALIDGEFDLQYAPLLEHRNGNGHIIFCQLDVSGRTTPDPVADQMTIDILKELLSVARPRVYKTCTILGDNAKQLCASLGINAAYTNLIIASSGAEMPRDLHQQIADGANVLCLGMNAEEIAKWSPVPMTVTFTNAYFTRIEKLPSELDGLSNADWAWHGQMSFYAFPSGSAEHQLGNQALRIIKHGKGTIVFWQVPPWQIDEVKKPYLRTTKRRANAMASRLLANLGATFEPSLGKPLYLDTPENVDDPYRYYRW